MSIFTHKVPEFDIKINKFPLMLSVIKTNTIMSGIFLLLVALNVWLTLHNYSLYVGVDHNLSQRLFIKEQNNIIDNSIFVGGVLFILTLLPVYGFFSEMSEKTESEVERRKVLFLGKNKSSQVMDYILSNKDSTSILFLGVDNNQTVFQELIYSGVNLNYQDNEGDTALHLITRYDMSFHVIMEMLLLGADPTIANNKGETAAEILDKSNHPLWISYQRLKFGQNLISEPKKVSRL